MPFTARSITFFRVTVAILCAIIVAMTTDASAQQPSDARSLLQASERGDLDRVRRILGAGVSVDTRDRAGRTPLLLATIRSHNDVARALIDAGADVNAQDDRRDSSFLYAGADVNIADRDGVTPLTHARRHRYAQIVRILEAVGAR
jgi:ankyrin repeat protein